MNANVLRRRLTNTRRPRLNWRRPAGSGTLVTADLLYNYQPEHNFTEKLFFRAIGCYGAPGVAFYHRYAIRDKSGIAPFQEAVGSWPVKRIVMCHGRIIEAPEAAGIFTSAWQRFA